MKQIRKILGMRLSDHHASIRGIAMATGCSRPVVKDYLDRLAEHPLELEQLTAMNDQTLAAHMGLETRNIKTTDPNRLLATWLESNVKRLTQKHMTRRLLHESYLTENPSGLQYSQFCFVLK